MKKRFRLWDAYGSKEITVTERNGTLPDSGFFVCGHVDGLTGPRMFPVDSHEEGLCYGSESAIYWGELLP